MYRNFGSLSNGFCGIGNFNNGSIGGYIMMGIGLVLLIAVVYLIFKKSNGSVNFRSDSIDPLDTLKNRFVNGEIDEEEFKRKKEILESK